MKQIDSIKDYLSKVNNLILACKLQHAKNSNNAGYCLCKRKLEDCLVLIALEFVEEDFIK